MPEQFCLKWSDFHCSIVTALDSLKCCEDLVDVTLTCEGQNIKAHKVVLSACSPYFRGVFKENPCQHPIIVLKDVLAADMSRLLAYMYQGEVTVLEDQLPALLQTAELLQVSGLTSYALTSQAKPKTNKPVLPISPNIQQQKKIVPQAISFKKKPSTPINVPRDTANIPILKTYQPKKKRSNSSEPVDLAPHDHFKKIKITKEKPSIVGTKVVEAAPVNYEHSKTDIDKDKRPVENVEQTCSKSGESTSSEGLDLDIRVKQEVDEVDSDETEQVPIEEPVVPKPFYETSMLARSLISGAQSIKNDTLASSAIIISKPPVQAVHNIPAIDIKTEGPDDEGFEPEIVISEDEIRAMSNVGNLPANHAAICGDCPHCGTQYSNQSALKYHVRLMHSDLTNRLCCYLCPRSFTVRDTFKEHMWTFHGQRN